MTGSAERGNDPERWQKFLTSLDEKLQLGLLVHLERVASYHFEEETLYIVPGTLEDYEYLTRPEMHQHLELLAEDAIKIERVKIERVKIERVKIERVKIKKLGS